ncbi:hypothetical protein F383_35561 [Gossypium arboreum]|uniref:Uncharacterized protein n=1 Tax=Gossypium arboreum TaxID=29729 RepID=A0A0B0N2D5_GOSAR|nr:hypothetical protein F383_35561 [Gossypium arboreum]
MSGTCISYKMCQCKTISGTWHLHEYCRLISSRIIVHQRHQSHYQQKHLVDANKGGKKAW